ncbi:MAG: hypothetical protein LLG04_12465 [Parachlamydia sp.]|nr:hypothetical protein [Parachlamydia sp.]
MTRSFARCTLKLLFALNLISGSAYGLLAGGRPNAISGGLNAFAGVVNPANAVWIEDRFDIGAFVVHQKSSLDNRDNNPLFPPGKLDLSYRTRILATADLAIHKRFKLKCFDSSFTLAFYTTPGYLKLRTKKAIPLAGTTPILVEDKVEVVSSIFSFKLNPHHSIGFSVDYFYLSHRRNGFQNSDNPLKSVSPGHVTNKGMDHSSGVGISLGWRWVIHPSLTFGLAFVKKSYVGKFRKYRGFEPHHAKNYIPETIGAGFTYRFTERVAGRLEVLWSNLGNLPNANNNLLSEGTLNLNKRGSNKSPGAGLQDATFINAGIGYKVNSLLSVGAGFSHRIKLPRKTSIIISHSYRLLTIYDILAFGANFTYCKHDFFFSYAHGFRNRMSGVMPTEVGGGKFASKKCMDSFSFAWGYLY